MASHHSLASSIHQYPRLGFASVRELETVNNSSMTAENQPKIYAMACENPRSSCCRSPGMSEHDTPISRTATRSSPQRGQLCSLIKALVRLNSVRLQNSIDFSTEKKKCVGLVCRQPFEDERQVAWN